MSSDDRKHGANMHTQKHRPWPSQREELDVRLLLSRRCHKVESLRAGKDGVKQQQLSEMVGFLGVVGDSAVRNAIP